MESSLSSIESLVSEVKKDILSKLDDMEAFVSPSAYDTAWLAMVPDQTNEEGPMFERCLNWIIDNQREGGFWGETNEEGLATIDALPATLACMVALKMWNAGQPNIESGLSFIHGKAAEILLEINYQNLPRWFVLTFPAMIELADAAGLHLVFPPGLRAVIDNIFIKRQQILQMEEVVEEETSNFPPLLSYLETLPSWYHFDRQEIVEQHLSPDGSLFESASATAQAFMSTKNINCLNYLQSLLSHFPNGGVPAIYPMDGDLIKLCMVDHIQGLGLAEYFKQEIQEILAHIYRNQKNKKSKPKLRNMVPIKLFKDALAFRLLRMHGHDVNPGSLCWFLEEAESISHMEEELMSAMYSVYRATDLQFPGEIEMEEARTFAEQMLQNSKTRYNFLISKGLQNMINYELNVPWGARLDHLYHRKWIEENKISPLWFGKPSFYRLSCLDNSKLMQLAVENFKFLQSIYAQELDELKRWSKKWRLSEMGFGREKTVYTYFAIASCSFLPYNSIMRLVIAKSAILVTVADDFYDMEASLPQLQILTDSIQRWNGEGLEGHSKTIFDALDDFVNDTAAKCCPQQNELAVQKLQHIWRETFMAWMVERRWSLTGHVPSMDEYLEIGMISTAAHTVALPATTFLRENTNPSEYHNITKLVMVIARLLNDIQSYQKEQEDGKMNLVMLHLNENPHLSIQDSVAYVEQIVDAKKKEFLQHVFMDGLEQDMAKSCKKVHLYCMKVFQMFFNSANLFDSETALVDDINKSIYLPIHHKPKPEPFVKPVPASVPTSKIKNQMSKISNSMLKYSGTTSFVKQTSSVMNLSHKVAVVPFKFNLCFI